jgi:hypothetical protein
MKNSFLTSKKYYGNCDERKFKEVVLFSSKMSGFQRNPVYKLLPPGIRL